MNSKWDETEVWKPHLDRSRQACESLARMMTAAEQRGAVVEKSMPKKKRRRRRKVRDAT